MVRRAGAPREQFAETQLAMSPFWAGLFENLQGRGRSATLFLVTLPSLLVLALVAAEIPREFYHNYILPISPFIVLLALVWIIRCIQQARARNRDHLSHAALSCDEMRKARAKLVKQHAHGVVKNSLVPPG